MEKKTETETKKVIKEIVTTAKGRKKRKLLARALAAIAAGSVMSSCTGVGASNMFSSSERGFVMLAGDAEGIRAYNDGLNGIISNTKASRDVKSSYWQNRDKETEVRKFRTPYYSAGHRASYTKQRAVNDSYNQDRTY